MLLVNRRIGGLEMFTKFKGLSEEVNRRIGGLKTCGTLAAATCWFQNWILSMTFDK